VPHIKAKTNFTNKMETGLVNIDLTSMFLVLSIHKIKQMNDTNGKILQIRLI